MTDLMTCLSIKKTLFMNPSIHPSWVLCGWRSQARKYSTTWPEANKNIEIVKNNWLHYSFTPVHDYDASGIAGKPSS